MTLLALPLAIVTADGSGSHGYCDSETNGTLEAFSIYPLGNSNKYNHYHNDCNDCNHYYNDNYPLNDHYPLHTSKAYNHPRKIDGVARCLLHSIRTAHFTFGPPSLLLLPCGPAVYILLSPTRPVIL